LSFISSTRRNRSRALILLPVAMLIFGAAVAMSRSQRVDSTASSTTDDSPELCVARLLAVEKRGDVRGYLSCFGAARRAELETEWKDRPPAQIARELRERAAGLVGQAFTGVELLEPGRAALMLERIEKDHIERQRVELSRTDGRWEITRLSPSDWQTPVVPYGTPVFVSKPEISGEESAAR
jgi:hypothetical protein